MKTGVLGAGTWGIALARMLVVSGHDVQVWSALPEEIEALSSTHKHINLPGVIIPDEMEFTTSIEEVCQGKDLLLFAVPSVFVRSTTRAAAPFISKEQIIVDVAKGIESETLFTMTQVIRDELGKYGDYSNVKLVALSGPTHAEEVARDIPSTIVAACNDRSAAEFAQSVFMNENMRVYTHFDVEGVELCGAVKNVIALAAGISSGLGYGDNTKAALITRGIAEMERLGVRMGCFARTFSGLAGIGDLIVTATSEHSRNNKCGKLIGQGISPDEAIKQVGMVVEGINALPAVKKLAMKYDVDMPISKAVYDVVFNNKNPREAVLELMNRNKRSETSKTIIEYNFESAILSNRGSTTMKRVITYGTFDLLHYGHINLLRRAKALGDYLVVALSTDEFNWNEKQKKCYFSYEQRKALLESIRYVDLVIPEENWDQKKTDVHEYHIDTFVIGDDWTGKFDFLKEEGVEVVYLPRTPEISTTQIKQDLQK